MKCVHCDEPVQQLSGYWYHDHGLGRCQSASVPYGHLAHPADVPCRANGPNPCLGATNYRTSNRPSSDRDGECICDYNPETTDGPLEDCPFHGRPYKYWVERADHYSSLWTLAVSMMQLETYCVRFTTTRCPDVMEDARDTWCNNCKIRDWFENPPENPGVWDFE